ncbi:MAG TPA: hypothetical protein VFM45_02375, partial [Anaeromyxobacteraceae bacterium]|nr:hypothetical protein [Anaeromyxobacteraceae bacterium]
LGGADIQVNLRADAEAVVSGNTVANNDISYTGRDYYDTAAIFFLFTSGTTVEHNTIRHVPWTGIATGWGWGLLDEGGFPGMPYAQKDEWGVFTTPTVTRNNRIASNRISHFLEQLWDGGAVYINGSQGWSPDDGLVLALNVADGKRPEAGSNVFYTDAGTRYVTMDRNVSMTNPVGIVDFGSCATPSTWEFSRSAELLIRRFGDTELTRWLIAILDSIAGGLCSVTDLKVSYGADFGGCVPRGHLTYTDNYFAQPIHFFDICTEHLSVPVAIPDVSIHNIAIQSESDVPAWILDQAGKR